MKTEKLTVIGLLTALALVLHIVEAMIPNPLPIPGVKLGLANIVALWALYRLDFSMALMITILRSILGCLLTGTLFSVQFILGGSGALLSVWAMAMALKGLPGMSPIGISLIGAVVHNMTQLAVAGLLIEQSALLYYLPILLLSAMPAGILTGVFTKTLLTRVNVKGRI